MNNPGGKATDKLIYKLIITCEIKVEIRDKFILF